MDSNIEDAKPRRSRQFQGAKAAVCLPFESTSDLLQDSHMPGIENCLVSRSLRSDMPSRNLVIGLLLRQKRGPEGSANPIACPRLETKLISLVEEGI